MLSKHPNTVSETCQKIFKSIEFKYQLRVQNFPEVGRQPSRERQHTILSKFPQNCMKLKEFGPGGGEGGHVQNFTM